MEHVFVTDSRGIGGRIKRRIADFQVQEVSKDGTLREIRVFTDTEKRELPKEWPSAERPAGREQLHLTLEKFNLDTNFAIQLIARMQGTSRKRIGFAGMKDKRGITCQRISIWQPDLERLKNWKSRYLDLREAEWHEERVELGDLWGNDFNITIRDLEGTGTEEELRHAIEACFAQMRGGIPNFFGEQRFGGLRQTSHRVGREFVKGSIENGVMLYLTATAPGEEEDVALARKNLAETRDFSRASNEFPVKYRYERAIIHHLCKYPRDFVGAFKKLPKALTYMFTHAYQSHLFNEVLKRRLAEGIGLQPVEGDVLEDGIVAAPLFGFESKLAEGKPGEIERRVLEAEGVQLADFKVKAYAELSTKGARKKALLVPEDLRLLEIAEDDYYPGKRKARIGFRLTKGNYATTVLMELMKAEGNTND